MARPIESPVGKVLEFLALAITVGSWLWITFFATRVVSLSTT